MLQDQLRYGILIALIAVGLFSRGMLCQQNNEGPSSSHSSGPASTDSANSQHNVIQADKAEDSNFYQTPIVGVVQSNIQQDKANLQYNSIQGNSAKKSNFFQMPIAGKVNLQDHLCYGILIALIVGGLFWGGMLRQQKNKGPSSSDSAGPRVTDSANSQVNTNLAGPAANNYAPQISNSANSQNNVIQAGFAHNSVFKQIPISRNVTQRTQRNNPQAEEN